MAAKQLLALCASVFLCIISSCNKPTQSPTSSIAADEVKPDIAPIVPKVYSKEAEIERQSSLYTTLKRNGFEGSEIHQLVLGCKPIINLGKLPGGTTLTLYFADASLTDPKKIQVNLSSTKIAWLNKNETDSTWSAFIEEKKIEATPVSFKGLVSSNLWDSAEDAGMPGTVVSKLAEVFAWQIDFNRELRVGDEWRLTVEQLTVDGLPIGWGNILAAEYVNKQESFVAVRFPATGKALGYFSPDGENLKKLFLKSPIAFGRITSGFSAQRMHPILGVNQPHNGVDYGAPHGTPVYAVGSGTVQEKLFRNSTGNHLRIRHNSIYATGYSHLKGFASGLKVGQKVEQGQVIAYVGATGLATGPHLHFSFFENGRYVNPQGLKFPSADPVPPAEMASFQTISASAIAVLPSRFTAAEKTELAHNRFGIDAKEESTSVSN